MLTECVEWSKGCNHQGYGERFFEGRQRLAHRIAYIEHYKLTLSDIKGDCVLHKCDNPPCINPEHLFLGTRSDNSADKVAKGRQAKGRNNGSFRDHDLSKIRELSNKGLTQRTIAKTLGCSQSFVSDVVTGRITEKERM